MSTTAEELVQRVRCSKVPGSTRSDFDVIDLHELTYITRGAFWLFTRCRSRTAAAVAAPALAPTPTQAEGKHSVRKEFGNAATFLY